MKTMHSLDYEFLSKLGTTCNAELLRCDTDFDEPKIAKIAYSMSLPADHLLSSNVRPCLISAAQKVSESGVTNGYELTLSDIMGVLFMWRMMTLIAQNVPPEMDARSQLNFFRDLADQAGYHVQMFEEEAYDEGMLSHFQSKLPDYFTHKIESDELRLLYCFYFFGSEYLDW